MANASVTVTGTPENPIFSFDIPQGEKGEPGGLINPIALNPGEDANNLTASGLYRVVSSNATTALNWPRDNMGAHIMVLRGASTVITQVAYPLATNQPKGQYHRWQVSGTWGPWQFIPAQRVDQTAGRAIYTYDDLNNREQLVWGDTGIRTVTASVLASFDSSGATRNLNIRRAGATVSISGQLLVAAGATSATQMAAYPIPAGFRPSNGVESTALQIRGNTSTLRAYTNGNDFCLQSMGGSLGNLTAGDIVNVNITYFTTEAWPSSLPGVAFGAIPTT